MGAAGNVESGTGVAHGEPPGPANSFGAALKLIVGWLSVAVAILNIATELDRVPDRAYLLFHLVLLTGGLLLISIGPGGAGSGPAGYSAAGAVLIGGMLAGALPVNNTVCCLTTFAVRHGYPFSFLARNDGRPWHLDFPHLLADLLFWGYGGLIVLALVALARRVTEHHGAARK